MRTTPAVESPYQPPESRLESVASEIEHTKSAIAQRLRRVCAGLSAEEFDHLIERMARVQIKYAALEQQQ